MSDGKGINALSKCKCQAIKNSKNDIFTVMILSQNAITSMGMSLI
jgi:hypothetical protein